MKRLSLTYHRIVRLRLLVVLTVLAAGAILGLVFGFALKKPIAGLLVGSAAGWFVAWIVGLAFEETEYRLAALERDGHGKPVEPENRQERR